MRRSRRRRRSAAAPHPPAAGRASSAGGCRARSGTFACHFLLAVESPHAWGDPSLRVTAPLPCRFKLGESPTWPAAATASAAALPAMDVTAPAVAVRGLWREFGDRAVLRDVSSRAAGRSDARGAGPERRRQDHPAAGPRDAAAPDRGRGRGPRRELPRRGLEGARDGSGYLGHEPLLYRDLTVAENLRFHARLHGLAGDAAEPDRRAAGAGAAGAAGRRAGPQPLGGHGPARRGLPRGPAPARAAAAGRAALAPRPRGGRAGRAADRRRVRARPACSSPTTSRRRSPRATGPWLCGPAAAVAYEGPASGVSAGDAPRRAYGAEAASP